VKGTAGAIVTGNKNAPTSGNHSVDVICCGSTSSVFPTSDQMCKDLGNAIFSTYVTKTYVIDSSETISDLTRHVAFGQSLTPFGELFSQSANLLRELGWLRYLLNRDVLRLSSVV